MPIVLPAGWTVTQTVQVVPSPEASVPPFFSRITYTCTDEHGNYVCSSGSEADCFSQALSVVQSNLQQGPYV